MFTCPWPGFPGTSTTQLLLGWHHWFLWSPVYTWSDSSLAPRVVWVPCLSAIQPLKIIGVFEENTRSVYLNSNLLNS